MKAKGLDHVAIAVKNLEEVMAFYKTAFGLEADELETVEDQKVRTAIYGHGMGRIELICPTEPNTSVAKFLEKRGEGLHHICIEVEDIEAALAQLKQQGAQLIDEKPKIGAGGAKIAFVHPKGAHGVLTELRQGKKA
jgi:methylmalonyl-CoA/ethylmalonyl-CoA epimerase